VRGEDFFNQLAAEVPVPAEVAAEVDTPFILAANVYHLRTELRLTQTELASRIGVAQPRIAEIERGDANPRLDTLARLAHALDVPVSALLERNDAAGQTAEGVPAGAQLRWSDAVQSLGETPSVATHAEVHEADEMVKRAARALGSAVRLGRGRKVAKGHVYEMNVFEPTYGQRVK
jgi:transcriptional regulator with XRE-family HTH domain